MTFLVLAIVVEVIGTTMLSLSNGFRAWQPTVAAVGSWALSLYLLALALRTMEVGTAYAIWSGLGTALLVGVGWFFLEQQVSHTALAGIGLIVIGVVVLQLGGAVSAH